MDTIKILFSMSRNVCINVYDMRNDPLFLLDIVFYGCVLICLLLIYIISTWVTAYILDKKPVVLCILFVATIAIALTQVVLYSATRLLGESVMYSNILLVGLLTFGILTGALKHLTGIQRRRKLPN